MEHDDGPTNMNTACTSHDPRMVHDDGDRDDGRDDDDHAHDALYA